MGGTSSNVAAEASVARERKFNGLSLGNKTALRTLKEAFHFHVDIVGHDPVVMAGRDPVMWGPRRVERFQRFNMYKSSRAAVAVHESCPRL
jgi:hypothetical protein